MKNVSWTRIAYGGQKGKVGNRMNERWTTEAKGSFDRMAKKYFQGVDLSSCMEMIVEGEFTRVIYLISNCSIPPMPFEIRLRWKSHPVAHFPRLQAWHVVCFRGEPWKR